MSGLLESIFFLNARPYFFFKSNMVNFASDSEIRQLFNEINNLLVALLVLWGDYVLQYKTQNEGW